MRLLLCLHLIILAQTLNLERLRHLSALPFFYSKILKSLDNLLIILIYFRKSKLTI